MRISLAIALIMVVISEMVASVDGIGYFILNAQRSFRVPDMYAGVITLGLLGYALNVLFVRLERRVLRWHIESH
jgi:ABC-type nitrate/sulfonate/bicarbonate transport system permease component